MFIVICGHN